MDVIAYKNKQGFNLHCTLQLEMMGGDIVNKLQLLWQQWTRQDMREKQVSLGEVFQRQYAVLPSTHHDTENTNNSPRVFSAVVVCTCISAMHVRRWRVEHIHWDRTWDCQHTNAVSRCTTGKRLGEVLSFFLIFWALVVFLFLFFLRTIIERSAGCHNKEAIFS